MPVYDTARVAQGLMKGKEYAAFAAAVDDWEQASLDVTWCSLAASFERDVSQRATVEPALSFVRYLTFCAQLVEDCDSDALRACRDLLFEQFNGQPCRRAGEAPKVAAELDAKIAEFCASTAARG
jgi:hypothetical protein